MLKIPYGGKCEIINGSITGLLIERTLTEQQHKYLRQWWKKNSPQVMKQVREGQR